MSVVPELALVRVVTGGGPYYNGETLSLAFSDPSVGSLATHCKATGHEAIGTDISVDLAPRKYDDEARSDSALLRQRRVSDAPVPETILVVVTLGCRTFGLARRLALSFVDPRLVRIRPVDGWDADLCPEGIIPTVPATEVKSRAAHSQEARARPGHVDALRGATDELTALEDLALHPSRGPRNAAPAPPTDASPGSATALPGQGYGDESGIATQSGTGDASADVRLLLRWTDDRIARFVTVVDKLFTVERLGWYRHVLAMRLLVPDELVVRSRPRDDGRHLLKTVRTALNETLGNPLLAAFMPNFSLSPAWLASLDSKAAVGALTALHELVLPFVGDHADPTVEGRQCTVGAALRAELPSSADQNVEVLLAPLLPSSAVDPHVSGCLAEYRRTLLDAFGQTASVPLAVRLGAMAQTHHALDDRLWQLVGAVSEACAPPLQESFSDYTPSTLG